MTVHNLIPPHDKRRIYDRQNGLCAYCGQHRNIKYMTIDHIVPLSKGGTNEESNLTCACKICNQIKGDMTLEAFSLQLAEMLNRVINIEAGEDDKEAGFIAGFRAGQEEIKQRIFKHFGMEGD